MAVRQPSVLGQERGQALQAFVRFCWRLRAYTHSKAWLGVSTKFCTVRPTYVYKSATPTSRPEVQPEVQPEVARRSTVVPCPRPSFQLSPPRLPYSPSPMRLASFSSHGCRSETPPTAGAGLKRVRVLSPSSSYESLEAHARHVSARIIQRRWRGLRRSSSGRELDQEPDSPFQAAESVGTDLATHRPLASLALPALTAVAAIIGAVAAGQALALEAPEVRVSQKSACPPTTAALLPPTRAPAPHLALPLPPSELVSHMACAQLSCLARWRRVPYS